jgi:hypothetical protein
MDRIVAPYCQVPDNRPFEARDRGSDTVAGAQRLEAVKPRDQTPSPMRKLVHAHP